MSTACSPAMRFATRGSADLGITSSLAYEARIETALDALADHLEPISMSSNILKIARSRQTTSASAA